MEEDTSVCTVAADCALCVELFLDRPLCVPQRQRTEPARDSESESVRRPSCSCRIIFCRRALSSAASLLPPPRQPPWWWWLWRRGEWPEGGEDGGVASIKSLLLSPMVLAVLVAVD